MTKFKIVHVSTFLFAQSQKLYVDVKDKSGVKNELEAGAPNSLQGVSNRVLRQPLRRHLGFQSRLLILQSMNAQEAIQ